MLFSRTITSVRTSRIFVAGCIIFSLGFQFFWLRNSYLVKKTEFLKEAEISLKDELILMNIPKIKTVLPDVVAIMSQLSDEDFTRLLQEQPADIPRGGVKNKFDMQVVSDLIEGLENGNPAATEKDIYAGLVHKKNRENNGLSFHINSYEGKRLVSTYPPHAGNITGTDTTAIVAGFFDEATGYQLSLDNLAPVILKSMTGQITMSLIFIVIAVVTFTILLYNINQNRRLLEMKSVFTFNITHELKIPVATLAVATEAMEKYDTLSDPIMAKRHIALMRGDISRLSGMIDSILSNARLEHGHIRLQKEVFYLRDLFKEVSERLQLQLAKQEGNLDFSGIPVALTVPVDKEQFISVLINLVDNAIKYALDKPEIKVTAEATADRIKISVADNGPGIPRHYWDQVFESYFRIQDDEGTVNGYGLGLSQAKHITDLHKGNIKVLSSNPSGTVFLLTIPATI